MTSREPVARLMLRAPNWLGDAVLAIPAMSALRRAWPEAQLIIAAVPSVAAIFREKTPVEPNSVLELPSGDRAAVAAIAAEHADACVLFPNSFRTAWQIRRARIPHRWGYGDALRKLMLTRAVRKPSARHIHQSEYYRLLVAGLDVTADAGDLPELGVTAASAQRGDALLHQHGWPADARFVAMLPGAAYGQAKQWPAARMADLASRIVREQGVGCVLLGAAHDRPAAREIESSLRDRAPDAASRVLNLVGHTSLGALAAILSRARLCISNDSGGMHVAAALGRPVIAIFGPTDERATRPLGDQDVMTEAVFCRPCMLRDCPIDHRCMKRISVDRVLAAAASRLSAQEAA